MIVPKYFSNPVVSCGVILILLLSGNQHGWSVENPIRAADHEIDFGSQIRPILSRHCTSCHGPDEEGRAANFRIDTFDGATESAIVPGEPDDSEVMERVRSDEEGYRMPPHEHGDALSEEEIALLEKWIAAGAEYEKHWSFVPPVKADPPSSEFDRWAGGNPIDSFVAAKIESKGLSPAEPAEPHRLIRRVALDLTGLPPTQEQVQRYVDDPTTATYEKIVDELLASNGYGEHWAAMWLDLARYADSIGYAEDSDRTIWPWRDWVIRAFNQNMPYDRFTIEQLAGDLLPKPTEQQLLATAFHRNTLSNSEGGTSDEEFRTIAVKDRISTTVNVWMGLTMRCAECHTHKYDPISHKEYYQFLDFFNQTEDSDKNDERPVMKLFPPEKGITREKLDAQIKLAKVEAAGEPKAWKVIKPAAAFSRQGTSFKILDDHSVLAKGKKPNRDDYVIRLEVPAGTWQGLRLEAIPDKSHRNSVGRAPTGAFLISEIRAETGSGDQLERHAFSDAAADFQQPNFDVKNVIDGVVDKKGWAVKHPEHGLKERRYAMLDFEKPLIVKESDVLTVTIFHSAPWNLFTSGRVRISLTTIEQPAQKFRANQLEPARRKLAELEVERRNFLKVPIFKELPVSKRRETYVNIRGSFLQPGEKVSASVPKAFNPLPEGAPKDRMGVAKWLVSPDNPLTARVTVNRFWARLFGRGIVETEEDFGTQGTLPTHLELIDWLAVDFQQNGWDVKRLLKQLVMTSTYRQTGVADKETLAIDPRNEYLSRGPRFRLSAEVVRDQALAVSGLLSDKRFGPPVYPPSPIKRITNAFTGGMTWDVSEGEDRYRRAIYTYLKRSQPHPLFDTFDMATREVCNMRRLRTNTPLQSFMTLNDETFIECAQKLASSMRDSGNESRQWVKTGLETALLRPAKSHEIETLVALYTDTKNDFMNAAKDARIMSGTVDQTDVKQDQAVERAALTVVANVILNLDSFLTH